MRRLSVRRSTTTRDVLLSATGLGLGVMAGVLLRGLVGGVNRRRLKTIVGELTGQHGVPSILPRRAAAGIIKSLAADEQLAGLEFDVVPVRIGFVELHGWVPSRAASARAMRIARGAAPETEVTNRLKVRGEDDPPDGVEPEQEERQPA